MAGSSARIARSPAPLYPNPRKTTNASVLGFGAGACGAAVVEAPAIHAYATTITGRAITRLFTGRSLVGTAPWVIDDTMSC